MKQILLCLFAFAQFPLFAQIDPFDTLLSHNPAVVWDYVGEVTNGLAPVRLDKKWGFIDTIGKLAIPLEYKYAESFQTFDWGGTWKAVVLKDNNYVFIDSAGNIIGAYTHPDDNYPVAFTRQLRISCENDTSVLRDDIGNALLISTKYSFTGCAAGMIGIHEKSSKLQGLMDYSGRVLVSPTYNYINVSATSGGYGMNHLVQGFPL